MCQTLLLVEGEVFSGPGRISDPDVGQLDVQRFEAISTWFSKRFGRQCRREPSALAAVHRGSDAKGTVKITSTDPLVKPAVRFNYLSTEQDRREWIEAVRVARRILNQPAFEPYNGGEVSPGPSVESDQEIMDWVAKDSETALHPSCTCKMGDVSDEMAVVDPATMRVHGVEGLRVVDASVMPIVSNGNIYAPTMMIAEKAADLILGIEPLAAEPVEVFRRR